LERCDSKYYKDVYLMKKKNLESKSTKLPAPQNQITHHFPLNSLKKKASIIMKACVDLVVRAGRPFNLFSDEPMLTILKLAKKQAREEDETINPTNVKKHVQMKGSDETLNLSKLLKNKMFHISLDMATLHERSFIGKKIHICFKLISFNFNSILYS
jgi:hypothetical protein